MKTFPYDKSARYSHTYLSDEHIDYFLNLVSFYTQYQRISPLNVANPARCRKKISEFQRHIQIINITKPYKHWVTIYYDLNRIFIYDSLNQSWPYDEVIRVLGELFPF